MSATADELVLDGRPTPTATLLRQIWGARGLINMLARKNFYVRYRRAFLGMLWAVGLPVIQAAVMALIFSRFRRGEAPGGSFPAYVISGYMVWSYFSNVVSTGATAVVDGASLSSRIYFPRAVLPLVQVLTNLHGFGFAAVVMSAIALAMRGEVEPTLPLLAVAVLLMVVMSASLSLVLSAVHVYFRDTRYIVTAIMQPWFFLTPIIWSPSQLPDTLADIVRFNPAAGFVQLTHLAIVGEMSDGWEVSVASAVVTTLVLGIAALRLHTRFDRVFADRL
jgi:ABC-type polysaccharide/polyol phosphate export permease